MATRGATGRSRVSPPAAARPPPLNPRAPTPADESPPSTSDELLRARKVNGREATQPPPPLEGVSGERLPESFVVRPSRSQHDEGNAAEQDGPLRSTPTRSDHPQHGGGGRKSGSNGEGRLRQFAGESTVTNSIKFKHHTNQKCRSEIIKRIDREEGGTRLRKLGWESDENRERLAREIKQNMFGYCELKQHDEITGSNGGDSDLEAACKRLEEAISRIPANWGENYPKIKGVEAGTKGEQPPGQRFGRSIGDIFGHS